MALRVTITIGAATYIWTQPGDALAKDYFIIPRGDGGLTFHLGALGDLAAQIKNQTVDLTRAKPMGLHHVKIENVAPDGSSTTKFDQDIPNHWWNAVWVFRPAPLQIKFSGAQIVAKRRMFAIGDMGKAIAPTVNYTPPGPMGVSPGITIGMPMTGERVDIGLITEADADYIETENAGPMVAWALSGHACPDHFRDEATGRPIDLLKYPLANCNDLPGLAGWPYLPKGPKMPDIPATATTPVIPVGYQQWGGGWVPQQAHRTMFSYLAFQATYDEDFLSDLQFSANFMVLCDAAKSNRAKVAVPSGEYRGIAWTFRNLFMSHISTLDYEAYCKATGIPFPDRLMPSSYTKALLDQAYALYSKSITDPTRQVFRVVSDLVTSGTANGPVVPPWQQDYMLQALGFGILTGHSDWAPLYLWALDSVVQRTSGKGSYPIGWGGGYYFDATQPSWGAAVYAGVPGLGGAEPPTAAQAARLANDPTNGGVAMNGIKQLMDSWAALDIAQSLDDQAILPVRQSYPDLDTCARNVRTMLVNDKTYSAMDARDSFVTLTNSAPGTITPLPAPPPPPAPAPTPPPAPPPATNPPPATGGIMTTILQGNGYRLTPRVNVPPGAVGYGVKPGSWVLDKTDQATLTPATDEQTAKIVAKVDTSSELLTVSCLMFVDAAKTKTISIICPLTDLLVEATGGTMDVAALPAG